MSRGLGAGHKKRSAGKPLPNAKIPKIDVPGGQLVAFSGGKDSTAMAERMAELGEEFALFFTPTGNELDELMDHINALAERINRPLVMVENGTLKSWIEKWNALPNARQRWCTRVLKIVPCQAFLKLNGDQGLTLCVGLRADEEERQGLYGSEVTYRYPLREWGWGLDEVWGYLNEKGITVPERTDCAVCPYQRLYEWYALWRNHPDLFEEGVAWEEKTGYTFRSDSRDTWPAGLVELRGEFENGRKPRGAETTVDQFGLFNDEPRACRVCSF